MAVLKPFLSTAAQPQDGVKPYSTITFVFKGKWDWCFFLQSLWTTNSFYLYLATNEFTDLQLVKIPFRFFFSFSTPPTYCFVSKKNLLVWDAEELWWWQYITVITMIVLLQNHLLQISKRCSFIPNPPCCCSEYWSGINQNSFIYCLLSATRSEVIRVCPRCNLHA